MLLQKAELLRKRMQEHIQSSYVICAIALPFCRFVDNNTVSYNDDERGIFHSLISTSFASKSSKCLAVHFLFRGA